MRTKQKDNETRKRLLWLGLLLVTWMLVIIWRLTWLQVLRHDHYVLEAAHNQQRSVETLATRGSIVDRNGKELAVTVITESLYADLKEFKSEAERQTAAQLLAPVLGYNEAELLKKLTGEARFVWLKRKLDPDKSQAVAEIIKTQKLSALAVKREPLRIYPNEELAASLIGFVGADEKNDRLDDKGLAGLEQTQDTFLHGKPGEIQVAKDGKNRPFGRSEIPALGGAQVVTTIDAALQHKIEVLLDEALHMSKAKAASAIVLDPHNGEVLALANTPGFNPNERPKQADEEARHNRVISWPYEPGSIFKIVTYAAAFEEGKATPTDMLNCGNGEIAIGKRVIHDTHAYGTLTVADAFAKSSNVCAIKLAQRLGKETFADYISRFGFGRKTGIELPAESRGIVNPLTSWRPDSIGSVAIGQEISVTLLQAAGAVATVANRGVWVQPHLVRQVVAPDARVLHEAKPATRQVVSEKTAQMMATVMERVVTHGTARHAIHLAGYTAAGKTGTPQKVDPRTKAYSQTKFMPSFAGFVPATDPKFVIVVMLDEPQGAHQGGSVAAPLFSMIAQIALGDFVVQPDTPEFRSTLVALSKRYETESSKEEELANPNAGEVMGPVAPSAETLSAQAKQTPAPVANNDRLTSSALPSANLAQTKPAQGKAKPAPKPEEADSGALAVMPDFRGRGVRAVMQLSAELRLNVKLQGTGVAVRQTLAPGTRFRPGAECVVEFH
ncbi:MAG: transpeptidase family protein [Acidobacteria bacterium]|nr:transpeptidase family protein [Acidobacteriota bacterium]